MWYIDVKIKIFWISLASINMCMRDKLYFYMICGEGSKVLGVCCRCFCCQQCGLAFSIIAATWTHTWKSLPEHIARNVCPVSPSSLSFLVMLPFFFLCLQLAGSLNVVLARGEKKDRIFESVPPSADVRGSDMQEWNRALECSRRE